MTYCSNLLVFLENSTQLNELPGNKEVVHAIHFNQSSSQSGLNCTCIKFKRHRDHRWFGLNMALPLTSTWRLLIDALILDAWKIENVKMITVKL